ncbi:MAG: hypothetical protein ABI180_03805 [Microcoleus sp.]
MSYLQSASFEYYDLASAITQGSSFLKPDQAAASPLLPVALMAINRIKVGNLSVILFLISLSIIYPLC